MSAGSAGPVVLLLLATVNELWERGIAFRSLAERIETTTPQGEFLFHVFGALAQFERSLTQERVMTGLDGGAAKAAVRRSFGIKRSTLIGNR